MIILEVAVAVAVCGAFFCGRYLGIKSERHRCWLIVANFPCEQQAKLIEEGREP